MINCGVKDLVLKIDVTDCKNMVKFVAVQQDSATLIYDLITIKRYSGDLI